MAKNVRPSPCQRLPLPLLRRLLPPHHLVTLTHKFLVDTYYETTILDHKIKLYALILWPFATYSIKKSWEKGGLVGEVAEEGGEVGVGGYAHFFA